MTVLRTAIVLPERHRDAAPLSLALAAVALQALDLAERAVEIARIWIWLFTDRIVAIAR